MDTISFAKGITMSKKECIHTVGLSHYEPYESPTWLKSDMKPWDLQRHKDAKCVEWFKYCPNCGEKLNQF